MNNAEQDRHLAKLPYANGAAFDSHAQEHESQCLPDTRVELCQKITRWSADPYGECVFWLNGMAGTGKSTIARTMAQSFAVQNRLGASFFFSRGRGDLGLAGKFFTTVAAQLASKLPALRSYISEAISENPQVIQQGLREQWKHLILQPISALNDTSPRSHTYIIVVDALDECESRDDVRLILRLLAQTKTLRGLKLRAFITSRPETSIRFGFGDIPNTAHQDSALHNIPPALVWHDISIFFHYEFQQIRKKRGLTGQWPGEHKIELLVQRADGLFIYAATACRFIQNHKYDPNERLSIVLEGAKPNQSPTGHLDGIYIQVIRRSILGDCEEQEKPEFIQRFRQIVGSIVVSFDTLPSNALAKLLEMPAWKVATTIDSLRSVLNVPDHEDQPVRLLHPSFRDFLLDKQRCHDQQFCVDEEETHQALAENCLRVMSENLKRDICGLRAPGALSRKVKSERIEEHLPTELQYACRYWVQHLQRSKARLYDNSRVRAFLQEHLLHWLEALSLVRKTSEGVLAIILLESMATVSDSPSISEEL
jgi:hypothetical protein